MGLLWGNPPILNLFWSKLIYFTSPPPGHSKPKMSFYFSTSHVFAEWHCATPVWFCLCFSPSAKMVGVMLACVHATVCEPQLRYCQDGIYAKKQGEKMSLGRNMERNHVEQINKVLTRHWDVESSLPDRRLQYGSRCYCYYLDFRGLYYLCQTKS